MVMAVIERIAITYATNIIIRIRVGGNINMYSTTNKMKWATDASTECGKMDGQKDWSHKFDTNELYLLFFSFVSRDETCAYLFSQRR